MNDERCGTCRFASPEFNYREHKCRRHAPITEKVESHQDLRRWVPVFPIVSSDDWCGDYEAVQQRAAPAQAESSDELMVWAVRHRIGRGANDWGGWLVLNTPQEMASYRDPGPDMPDFELRQFRALPV